MSEIDINLGSKYVSPCREEMICTYTLDQISKPNLFLQIVELSTGSCMDY